VGQEEETPEVWGDEVKWGWASSRMSGWDNHESIVHCSIVGSFWYRRSFLSVILVTLASEERKIFV
jgi:hypothetical protein